MFAILCAVVFALSAPAQGNRPLPATRDLLADVAVRNAAPWVMERTVVHGDIAHYRMDVVAGPGKFDVIRLHRVVREQQPNQPIQTKDAVMLLPGNPTSFEMLYMQPSFSSVPTWDRSIAVFLAKNDIDVWGIDYGWALVPLETTNFGFMKGWDVWKDAEHARIALSIARWMRGSFWQRVDPLYVAGLSYGALIAYSVAGEDAQLPAYSRNVKAIIPLDWGVRLQEASDRAGACDMLAADLAKLHAGVYQNDFGAFGKQLADLAKSAPSAKPSLLDPELTNYQAALLAGSSGQPPISWHFVGGYLDEHGIPTDLRYTEAPLYLDILGMMPPYYPTQLDADVDAMFCAGAEVPFEDHLARITVPILYIGAAGGFGQYGDYTTTLTSSKDVTKRLVKFLAPEQRMMDFGHADMVAAKNAETLVWKPILDWIKAHR